MPASGGAAAPRRPLPPAATVLRRALVGWGLGHLAIGDRRGWLLLAGQPLATGTLVLLAAALIDGTRWIVVFPTLVLFLAAWVGQAVDAQRRAVAAGAAPGGELQIAWLLPVVVVLVTSYWLVGGEHGSAAATLREYVAAWRGGSAQAAVGLFREPPSAASLAAAWSEQERDLADRVARAASAFGPTSGIDPGRPFNSLRFLERPADGAADSVTVGVEIVRRQRVETMLLGIIPTAAQQTVVVDQFGVIRLHAVAATSPAWLPAGRPLARVWRIESVELGPR